MGISNNTPAGMTHKTWNVDSAHGGRGWRPRAAFDATVNFGSSSEVDSLARVMLHRPGAELSRVVDPGAVDWNDTIDWRLAADQIDTLANTYASLGVDVTFLEPADPQPNHMFLRDLFTMTKQGAIVSRMAGAARAGEESAVSEALSRAGIPILRSIAGAATFEGPDLMFYDRAAAFVAYSVRSNELGGQQIAASLKEIGIETTLVETTFGCGHLDGVVSLLDRNLAIVYPKRVSFRICQTLVATGYTILELPDQAEAEFGMAINLVAVAPRKVVMPAGNPRTRDFLEAAGVEVHVVDLSEVQKGGGSVHCVTGVIERRTSTVASSPAASAEVD